MHCSRARIEANRRNAQKSTGPRTAEGKAASRGNAIKHGLCSSVCIPEAVEDLERRAIEIYGVFKPYNEYQAWHVSRAAVLTLRIERCEAMERRSRDRTRLRAELTWDDDRRFEAEVDARRLAKWPSETVEALRRTPQGCEWLMTRWAMLAHASDSQPGGWTEAQSTLAFDLMATPPEFREGRKPGAEIDFLGRVIDPADDPAAVARRMVQELMERREAARDLDDVDRALTEADLNPDGTSELRRLRRYESALHSRLRWTVKQMQFETMQGKPDPYFYPKYQIDTPPEEKPEPKSADERAIEAHDPNSFSPPFDLEPDEFPEALGQRPDLAKLLESRKRKKREKREAGVAKQRSKARKLHA